MPIFLPGPNVDPKGPDGQGRNRLRVDAIEPTARCALRPRTFAALRESQNTALAQWGGHFAPCTGSGQCSECPRATRQFSMDAAPGELFVRLHAEGSVHYTADLAGGWNAELFLIDWDDLAALESGWRLGRLQRDEHSHFIAISRT